MRSLLPLLRFAAFVATLYAWYRGLLPWTAAVPLAIALWILKGPVALYARISRPLQTPYEVLADDAVTDEESDQWGRETVAALAARGFVPRQRFREAPDKPIRFVQRLDNPQTGEVATLMVGQLPFRGPLRMAVFMTRFVRDRHLGTTNSPLPPSSPVTDGNVLYRLPEERDILALYDLHQRFVRADGRSRVRIAPSEDPLSWDIETSECEIAASVDGGYGVRDTAAGVMRLTWRGAFRNAWIFHPRLTARRDRLATEAALAAVPA